MEQNTAKKLMPENSGSISMNGSTNSKRSSGKALDKHCMSGECSRRIRGSNWAAHAKLHTQRGEPVKFTHCEA
jgi:hypothetical protein